LPADLTATVEIPIQGRTQTVFFKNWSINHSQRPHGTDLRIQYILDIFQIYSLWTRYEAQWADPDIICRLKTQIYHNFARHNSITTDKLSSYNPGTSRPEFRPH
jgi:hypothetical protein